MTHESTLASHLMQCGWELWISSDPNDSPQLQRANKTGRTTTVGKTPVSHDAVLDLHESGTIEKRSEVRLKGKTIAIYTRKKILE